MFLHLLPVADLFLHACVLLGSEVLQKWMSGRNVFVAQAKQERGTMAFSPPLHRAKMLQSLEEGLPFPVRVNERTI